MKVSRLSFEGFRNLQTGSYEPCEGVNIIVGENAQGKTNILEALWLFTGTKSFRSAKDKEMIAFGAEQSLLKMDFFAAGRQQEAQIRIINRRMATLNGIKQTSPTKLAGVFCGVVFSPAHLSLIKGSPAERRKLIDAAFCQLHPSYIQSLSEYARVLEQRNALCKTKTSGEAVEEMLDLWDRQLAQSGCKIIHARRKYLYRLSPIARQIYQGICSGKEEFDIRYASSVEFLKEETPAEIAVHLYNALREHRKADFSAGFTTVGPHRDDMEIYIGGNAAKNFGSQGQQRSAVLAIKLAEAALLEEVTGEKPIALLDDVMSELDRSRQEYILNHIKDWQVFITCCDPSPLSALKSGKTVVVSGGKLSTKE